MRILARAGGVELRTTAIELLMARVEYVGQRWRD
jgi:hypothetical protein